MKQRGFTLLEVLITIALFALLGLASYQLLERVLHSERRIQQHEQQLRQLQRALDIFQRDLWQTLPAVLPDDPSRRQALIGRENQLRLMRGGWSNPLQQRRSDLMWVEHHWEQGQWLREYRSADGGPSYRQRLLDGVELTTLRYIDGQGRAVDAWPSTGGPLSLPRALEIELDAPGYPALRRVILMPGVEAQADKEAQADE